jgi:hypothetical protein
MVIVVGLLLIPLCAISLLLLWYALLCFWIDGEPNAQALQHDP